MANLTKDELHTIASSFKRAVNVIESYIPLNQDEMTKEDNQLYLQNHQRMMECSMHLTHHYLKTHFHNDTK